jgi:nucleolar protein 12
LDEEKEPEKRVELLPPPKKDEVEDLDSTVFVGNVPIEHSQKEVRKIFAQYGKINKIWFRSIPVTQESKLKRKANCILKQYQEGADSKNAYVKFEERESAEKACAVNGLKVEEHTLRVSLCLDDNLDYETTVFVGNLPLDIKEEELRNHFSSVGNLVNVRVVRDKITHRGIGIGYVRFTDKPSIFFPIQPCSQPSRA